MNSTIYELLSLALRYGFAAIALFVAVRGWMITTRDSGRDRSVRAWRETTAARGELLAVGRGRRRNAFPLLAEGNIGSSRKCDVRIHGLRRDHAEYFYDGTQYLFRARPGADLLVNGVETGMESMPVRDGDVLTFGAQAYTFVAFAEPEPPEPPEDLWKEAET